MLDPKKVRVEANVVNVDFKLDDRQRAVLVSQVQQEGFDIFQRLFIDVIREFNVALMNTPVTKPNEILANHMTAKVAAQIYEAFMERLRSELELHTYNAAKLGSPENPEASGVTSDFE